MAMHTYIGARYVPKFLGAYDPTQSYEALDVVDNGSGTSYIARIPVPAGTPLTDTTYWFLYGSSSGAIIQLQNDMIQAQNDILTLQGKTLESYTDVKNVKDYGAEGDGITDDTAAIQSALAGGGVIYFPTGVYLMTDSVSLDSNTHIICDGVIKDAWDNYAGLVRKGLFDADTKENIIIEGMQIKGSGSGGSGVAMNYKEELSFTDSKHISVKNCKFEDINAYWCIRFNVCQFTEAVGNVIDKYSYGGIGNLNGGDYFIADRNTVLNCRNVDATNTYPITLNAYEEILTPGTHMGENLRAVNNYIRNDLPHWVSIDAHGGHGIVVTGNICENVYEGIDVFTDSARAFDAEDVEIGDNIIIVANDSTRRSVSAYGITIGAKNGSVHDNTVVHGGYGTTQTSAGAGIYVNNSENVRVHDNQIIDSYVFGILVFSGNSVLIENNIIDGVTQTVANQNGIGINFGNSKYGEIIVKGNKFKNCDFAFSLLPTITADASYHPYIRFIENVYDEMTFDTTDQTELNKKFIRGNDLSRGLMDWFAGSLTGMGTADTQGRKGDIIRQINPDTGVSLGIICTRSNANDGVTGAVWKALPSI